MRKLNILLALTVLVLALSACGNSSGTQDGDAQGDVTQGGEAPAESSAEVESSEAAPVKWRFAHAGNNDDALDIYAKTFKEKVEAEFPHVTVELFPAEQLGNDDERLELVQNGGTEFAFVATPFIGNVLPEAQAFGLSFIFPEDGKALKNILREGQAVARLNEMLTSQNIMALDWFNEDFSCWTSNKPINSLDDIKGQKIRVMNSPVNIANVEATGANPTPITYAEVYSALQLNTVDGQQNPIVIIEKNKFYEVQKYLILSNHEVVIDVVTANLSFWESLTEDEQAKLQQILWEVNDFSIENQSQQTATSLQVIKDSGKTEVIELSPEALEEFKSTSPYAQDKFIELTGESGKEILTLLLEDVENLS